MFHIKKLVIFGGPPAVGKSHVIEQIQRGEASEICSGLQLHDTQKIRFARAQTLTSIADAEVDTLILHYDFLGPFIDGQNDYDDKGPLSVMYAANEVVFVTLWAPPAVLSDRIFRRRVREKMAFAPKLLLGKEGLKQQLDKLRRFKDIQRLYDDPIRLTAQYEKWLDFCDDYFSITHFIFVNVEGNQHFIPLDKWQETPAPNRELEKVHAL